MSAIIWERVAQRHGFVREEDMDALKAAYRLQPVLVRCGGKRFVAPVQDALSMIALVEASGDYVRDVSIPAGDPAWSDPKRLGGVL